MQAGSLDNPVALPDELVQSSDGHCIAQHSWQGCLPPPANTFKGCPYSPNAQGVLRPAPHGNSGARSYDGRAMGGAAGSRSRADLALRPPTCEQAAAHATLVCMGAEPAYYAPGFGPWPLAWGWFALGLLLGAAFVTCVWCAWASCRAADARPAHRTTSPWRWCQPGLPTPSTRPRPLRGTPSKFCLPPLVRAPANASPPPTAAGGQVGLTVRIGRPIAALATTKVGGCRPCIRGRQCAGRIARSPHLPARHGGHPPLTVPGPTGFVVQPLKILMG